MSWKRCAQTLSWGFAMLICLPPLATADSWGQDPAGTNPDSPRRVAIFVYPNVELLDFAGPGEVFQTARAGSGSRPPFEVFTVAEKKGPLVSQRFLTIEPQYSFATCPPPDILVLPGGGVPHGREEVIEWIRKVHKDAEVVMSVCNGAALLGKAGLLDGRNATTHHGSLEMLQASAPECRVLEGCRYVDNGDIVTTAGVSAGIDGALHLVARLLGREAAVRTARYMEYAWQVDAAEAPISDATPVASRPHFVLLQKLKEHGLDAVLADYRARVAESGGDGAVELPAEMPVNQLAYAHLGERRIENAILLFEFNAKAFPASANVYDSLADGYEAAGRIEDAITLSKETLRRLESDAGAHGLSADRIRESAVERIERLNPKEKRGTGTSKTGGTF